MVLAALSLGAHIKKVELELVSYSDWVAVKVSGAWYFSEAASKSALSFQTPSIWLKKVESDVSNKQKQKQRTIILQADGIILQADGSGFSLPNIRDKDSFQ